MRTKNKFIVFILSILSIFFISCGKKVEKIEESKFLFGTYIKIIVYSDNKEKAMESIEKAFNEIQRIDEKYNSKSEGSLIYNLNNSDNKTVKLDEEGIKLFEGVNKAYELSGHKYDVTIAPLLELWGFTDETIELPDLKLPTKEEIEFTKTFVDYGKVKISDDGILTMESPVKEIDTGSFLKGYAISKAREVLKADGIKSAFITSISSIEVIGTKPENKPWKIGLQNPENPSDMIGIVPLKDRAMGVSGDYQTYVEIDGKMYHHILDKDTGYPVTDKKMVVVLCDNAFDADLLSTTFFLMPIDEVISYVDGRKDLDVLIVDKDMNIIERLEKYMDFKQLNPNKVTVEAGLSVGLLSKSKKKNGGLNSDTIEKILYTYTDLSPEWFLTGRGEMLKAEHENQEPEVTIIKGNRKTRDSSPLFKESR